LKLYLVRHGRYVPIDVSMSCPLSLEGQADIKRLASYLAKLKLRVPQVYHSTKLRAQQTAKILADTVNNGQCDLLEGLEPNDRTLPILQKIKTWSDDTMLVGHLPFVGILTSELVAAENETALINYEPGTIVCLANDNGEWKIDWVLNPSMY
jgi:phosphohistidine phosphatase